MFYKDLTFSWGIKEKLAGIYYENIFVFVKIFNG